MTGEASGKLVLQLKDSVPNMADTWEKHGFGIGVRRVQASSALSRDWAHRLLHFYFGEFNNLG